MILSTAMVGNEFVMPQPRLSIAVTKPATSLTSIPVQAVSTQEFIPVITPNDPARRAPLAQLIDILHRYSLATFALLFLLVGSTGVQVGGNYWSARTLGKSKPVVNLKTTAHSIVGLNLSVPSDQLQAKLETITSQPASLTVGDQTAPISPSTIKSWLQITPDAKGSKQYIHIKADSISKSLAELANKYVRGPVDQVSVTHDGSSAIVVAGINGTKLSDPGTLVNQAAGVAKTVMDAKGLQFTTPLESVPFQAITPAAFNKLIEVNVVAKQMYLYDNGQLTRSYPISAGAAQTPTPIGEYHIYSKLSVQDMKGFNPNGTKYLQPHVRWINYFLPGGYAVHGNYWRPLNFFGAVNSSHGCVSLPEDQAKWVYDWAPLGTTVITHR